MNKELKNIKRRWRKIGKPNRTFYRGMTIIAGINILLIPVISNAATNVMWILFIMIMYSTEFVRRRRTQYAWYNKGRFRQLKIDRGLFMEVAVLRWRSDRLNAKCKKMEYDCNQLKKEIKRILKDKKEPFKNKKK